MKEYILTGMIIFFLVGTNFAYDSYTSNALKDKKAIFYFSLIFIWPFFFVKDCIIAVKNFKLF